VNQTASHTTAQTLRNAVNFRQQNSTESNAVPGATSKNTKVVFGSKVNVKCQITSGGP